jgi:hypothetical protein
LSSAGFVVDVRREVFDFSQQIEHWSHADLAERHNDCRSQQAASDGE